MPMARAVTATKLAFALGVLNSLGNGAAGSVMEISRDPEMFSSQWASSFGSDAPGCTGPAAKDPYEWRQSGYGSNMNHLLLVWINAIAAGRKDVAVIVNTKSYFSRTKCDATSNGIETRGGWPCIFSAVPHLCAFDSVEDWISYNAHRNVSESEMKANFAKLSVWYIRREMKGISDGAVKASGVGIREIHANLFDYLHGFLQPWFKADVKAILDEPAIAALRGGKYVSMHIRRTDKITTDSAPFTETKKYFETALKYINDPGNGLTAKDMRGLWLSTDDETVVAEVKKLAPKFFPNIDPNAVVHVSDRTEVTLQEAAMEVESVEEGATYRNTYEAIVILRAELEMMAGATVFCGTFTSNFGRIVILMRMVLKKPDGSALSADRQKTWHIGR